MTKRILNEVWLLLWIITIFIIGIILDSGVIKKITELFIIDNDIINDLKISIFSAQVSISTLSIALISILTGLINKDIYGINLLRYFTYDKPIIFKHRTIIVMQLIMIFISYFSIAINKYSLLIATVTISFIMTIVMIIDIFKTFNGNEYLKKEIDNYIIYIFSRNNKKYTDIKKNIIKDLKNHTKQNIYEKNTLELIENIDIFLKLFEETMKNNLSNKNYIILQLEDALLSIFSKIFEDKDSTKYIIVLEKIQNLYKKCNEINKELNDCDRIYLNIYDRIHDDICIAISKLLIEGILQQEQYKDLIFNLPYDIYNNMKFEDSNLINNKKVNRYFIDIYYELKIKGYTMQSLGFLREHIFKSLEYYISLNHFDESCNYLDIFGKKMSNDICEFREEKLNEIYMQIYLFIDILLRENDTKLLEKVFFDRITDFFDNYSELDSQSLIYNMEYRFTIIIYMYYLIITKQDKDDNIKNIIKENKNIKSFFEFKKHKFTEKNINAIKNNIERLENNCSKIKFSFENTDHIVELFIKSYILYNNKKEESLTEELRTLFYQNKKDIYLRYKPEDESDYYIDYMGKSKRLNRGVYNEFISLFIGEELESNKIDKDIKRLEYAIINLYKEYLLKEDNNNDYSFIEETIKNQVINNFDKIKKCKLDKNDIKVNTELIEGELYLEHVDINFFKQDNAAYIECINAEIESSIAEYIINILDEKIEKVNDLYERKDLDVDTIIGSIHRMSGNAFRYFIQNKFMDNIDSMYPYNNPILIIDSKRFKFNIENVSIKFDNVDVNNIISKLDKNEKHEYLYKNYTDKFYYRMAPRFVVPFTEFELKDYLQNKTVKVKIQFKAKIWIDNKNIGIGVF